MSRRRIPQGYCKPIQGLINSGKARHSTLKVRMGTFKSGADNIQLHHWSNAKPAALRADAEEAQMPTRGRPKKSSSPADVSTPTDASSEAVKPVATVKNKQQSKPVAQPTRRSERIRAQIHATSLTAEPQPTLQPPPGFWEAGKFKPQFK